MLAESGRGYAFWLHLFAMRQIYSSTACLSGTVPLFQRIAEFQSCGLDAVELGHGVTMEGVSEHWVAELRKTELSFLVHNYFPPLPPPDESFVINLASPVSEVRTRSIDFVRRALQLSASLGAPFYSVHAGFVIDPYGFGANNLLFHDPTEPDAARHAAERFSSAIGELAEDARITGTGLLVENNSCPVSLPRHGLLRTPEEITSFFSDLGASNVGLLLDTGHLRVASSTLGFSPSDALHLVAPFVRAVHLHDNDGTEDYHLPVTMDSWAVSGLRSSGLHRTATITIEGRFDSSTQLKQHVDAIAVMLSLP